MLQKQMQQQQRAAAKSSKTPTDLCVVVSCEEVTTELNDSSTASFAVTAATGSTDTASPVLTGAWRVTVVTDWSRVNVDTLPPKLNLLRTLWWPPSTSLGVEVAVGITLPATLETLLKAT
jgi:hypothetical protein